MEKIANMKISHYLPSIKKSNKFIFNVILLNMINRNFLSIVSSVTNYEIIIRMNVRYFSEIISLSMQKVQGIHIRTTRYKTHRAICWHAPPPTH